MKQFKTSISQFDAIFKLEHNTLLIQLRSIKDKSMLLARYTQDTIPEKLHNVTNTPGELYDIIEEIGKTGLKISKENQLILLIPVGKNKRQFILPLEKAELSTEDKLRWEIELLTKEVANLKMNNENEAARYKKDIDRLNTEVQKQKAETQKWKKQCQKKQLAYNQLESNMLDSIQKEEAKQKEVRQRERGSYYATEYRTQYIPVERTVVQYQPVESKKATQYVSSTYVPVGSGTTYETGYVTGGSKKKNVNSGPSQVSYRPSYSYKPSYD